MEFRYLGKTDLKVSALGFGGMRLPMEGNHVETEKSIKIIQHAFKLGVNLIDSAVGYCNQESELTIGKALKGWRDKIIVSTKNHYRGNNPIDWKAFLNQSLKRLKIDYLDIYNFHGLRLETLKKWSEQSHSPLDEMKKAKKDGIIKHIGCSCHDSPSNMIAILETGMFESMILQYNLINTINEKVMNYAKSNGIGIIIMGPVGGGRLATPNQILLKMIKKPITSTAELALRFVLSNPDVSTALSGMNTIEMVEENVGTASINKPLNAEERKQILQALEEKKKLADLYCTGCGYCIPCPNGVDIPKNFDLLNNFRIYGLENYARREYERLGRKSPRRDNKSAWAVACVECGFCEEKCPQNIQIREQLKEVNLTLK